MSKDQLGLWQHANEFAKVCHELRELERKKRDLENQISTLETKQKTHRDELAKRVGRNLPVKIYDIKDGSVVVVRIYSTDKGKDFVSVELVKAEAKE